MLVSGFKSFSGSAQKRKQILPKGILKYYFIFTYVINVNEIVYLFFIYYDGFWCFMFQEVPI